MWLVTGSGGRVGRELQSWASELGITNIRFTDRRDFNITNSSEARRFLESTRPSAIINCAGFTDVDAAETDPYACLAANVDGVQHLASWVADQRAHVPLIHLSTDYVFGSLRRSGPPFNESEKPDCEGVYAQSKLHSERIVQGVLPSSGYIVRTGWLYSQFGRSFVRQAAENALTATPMKATTDQFGQPTSARELAAYLLQLTSMALTKEVTAGIFHATNSGFASRWDLARSVYSLLGVDQDLVQPARASDFAGFTPRPAYTVLTNTRRDLLPEFASWDVALQRDLPLIVKCQD